MDVVEIGCEGGDWIQLAQDRVQWPAALDTVINLKVPQNAVTFPQIEPPSAFQEGMRSVEVTSYSKRTLRFESGYCAAV
jgi:hypothetical protein